MPTCYNIRCDSRHLDTVKNLLDGTGCPWAVLPSGAVVLNFSSPHDFKFDGDVVLGRCPSAESEYISYVEREVGDLGGAFRGPPSLITVDARLTPKGLERVESILYDVDVVADCGCAVAVITPRPVVDAIAYTWRVRADVRNTWPFVTGRLLDREGKVLRNDVFCTQLTGSDRRRVQALLG